MTDIAAPTAHPPLIEFDPFFGGFVLETLTIGLYGEARSAIREYLQNGLDSVLLAMDRDVTAPAEAKIDVTIEDDALVIRDNGVGLERGKAVGTLTSVGASLKDYREQAGFRGIGRLAGIAFCDSLIFLTKARGDTVYTRVVFDAKQLRKDMAPGSGGQMSLLELLEKNVKATQPGASDADDHYFEVRLEGLGNAPGESRDIDEMVDFISQVAPVAYADDFTFRAQVEEAASVRRFGRQATRKRPVSGLEEVRILVHSGTRTVEVRKPYHATYAVGRDDIHLSDILIREGKSKRWWGWIGIKREPGAFKNESTAAIRIRVRNIQIDGTQIMGQIFSDVPDAKSYGRFNDWYVGEIFIDPTFVIPNSRRDGFEEDAKWELVRGELVGLCEDLGKLAYDISKEAQHSIKRLAKDLKEIEDRTRTLVTAPEANTDKLIGVSTDVTKLQRRVSRAFKYADLETASQLRSLENKLLDTKTRAVRKLGVSQSIDIAQVREEAQLEVLRELMSAFREQLEPETFSKVAQVVTSVAGTIDF